MSVAVLLATLLPSGSAQTPSPPFAACGTATRGPDVALASVEWDPIPQTGIGVFTVKLRPVSAEGALAGATTAFFYGVENPDTILTVGVRPAWYEAHSIDPAVAFHLHGVQAYYPAFDHFAEGMAFWGTFAGYTLALAEQAPGADFACPTPA